MPFGSVYRPDIKDLHACGGGGLDAGVGVFKGEAGGGGEVQLASGFEVDVGVGLAAGNVLRGDDDGDFIEQVNVFEDSAADGVDASGGDGDGFNACVFVDEV